MARSLLAFFDENLIRTLVGSLFGTFAGAWLTRRGQAKKELATELNNVAAAIQIAAAICNQYMALKRQTVRPTWEAFTTVKNLYEATKRADGTRRPFHYIADLKMFPQIKAPLGALEGLIYNHISMRGRGLAAMAQLVAAANGLDAAINERTGLIKEFKEGSGRTEEETLVLYLGLRNKANVIDDRLPSNLAGISLQTDCCIFFSYLIEEELVAYGNRLLNRYRSRLHGRGRRPFKPIDWTVARDGGLLPPDSEFEPWMRGFPESSTRWKRFASAFRASRTGVFTAAVRDRVATLFAGDPDYPGLAIYKVGSVSWSGIAVGAFLWWLKGAGLALTVVLLMIGVPIILGTLTAIFLFVTLLLFGLLAGAPGTSIWYAVREGFRRRFGILGVILGMTGLIGAAVIIAGITW